VVVEEGVTLGDREVVEGEVPLGRTEEAIEGEEVEEEVKIWDLKSVVCDLS